MTITKPITQKQFNSLIDSLRWYDLLGISGDILDNPEATNKWNQLRFKYSGHSTVGHDFILEHPFSRLTGSIDRNTIEISFRASEPFELRVVFKITDANQVSMLESAIAPMITAYNEQN